MQRHLILSRRLGEVIVFQFGHVRIEIAPYEVARGWVRLGIRAPAEVSIMRAELLAGAIGDQRSAVGMAAGKS
jgi:carbon storage regulator CsrA